MLRIEKAGLLVLVRDRTEVPSDDLEVGVLPDVVLGHLEHPQVEVGDGAEGPARDEHDWLFVGVPEDTGEAVCWELVVRRTRQVGRRRWRSRRL